MKYVLFICCFVCGTILFAQKPNAAYRLPEEAGMPEWAKQLYQEDFFPNVYALDQRVKPWKAIYDSLKSEVRLAEPNVPPALEQQFRYYKKYWKYYDRWRHQVRDYIQDDGALNFEHPAVTPPQKRAETVEDRGNSANWQLLGPKLTYWAKNDNSAQPPAPWQSNIYAIDVCPANPNVLYYGAETGALGKTTDKGNNWTPIGMDNTNFRGGIGAIAAHPTDVNTVFVGNNSGVHKSTDAGSTWAHVLNISSFGANDIKVNPGSTDELLAAGSSLQRYTVAGGWTNIINRKTYDLAFKPGDPNTVYALIRNSAGDLCEFYKSTNAGQTFTLKSSGWISALGDGGGRMTVTPADANTVYVVLLTNSGPRVLRSSDAGENWSLVASGSTPALPMDNGQGFFDLSITASHNNADHILVATTTAYKSTDGGINYSVIGGYSGSFGIHPDIQEMVTLGDDSWIATDGGINYSSDFWTSTSNFSSKLNGLTGTHFWGFDMGWNEDAIVGGRYHNGNTAWHENYPAGSFLRMGGGEQATGYINPGNSRMAYFSDLGPAGRMMPATLNENFSTFTVTKFPNEAYTNMEWGEQEWDPLHYYTYYLGRDNILWRTNDNGRNFDALYTHPDAAAKILHIEVSRSNPEVIYFTVQRGASGELWKSINGGQSWDQCNNPPGPTAAQRRISQIALSGTDHNVIWWCFRTGNDGNKVFKSTDGGTAWTNITTPVLNGISLADMVHQLGTDGGIYLNGNYGEVFYRNNTMSEWMPYKTGLPAHLNTEISRIKIQYKKKKLRMAANNGIWEVDLFENSTTTLPQPMADARTSSCSKDTIQLESYAVVNGAATYQWSITPTPQWISSATSRNPRVVFGDISGSFAVELSVTDDNGTSSKTVSNFFNNLPSGNLCKADTIPGKSLLLDGSGDYALASRSLNLNSNKVTMTAWVKRNGAQVDFSGLVFFRGGTTICGLSITSSNALRYTWDNQAESYNFNTGFTIPDNVWTHVALVVTPTSAKVYMNGVAATRTATHPTEAFDTPLQIGYDNGSRYFKGQIEEVTIWNRSLTQDSIRELMHLTLPPQNEPELLNYYQFNETSGSAYDRAGTVHATMLGNADRQISTTPVGKGYSARQTVNGSGAYNFGQTGLTLTFPASGPYPNGELCVSRINQAPDQLPDANPFGNAYWIVNNYGANSSFAQLSSLQFNNYGNIAPGATPSQFSLFKRGSFADGNTWGAAIDIADAITTGINSSILFSTSNNVTSFSQFIVSTTAAFPVEWLDFQAKTETPNQVKLNWAVQQTTDVSHYEIEKSADGVQFEVSARVDAHPGAGKFNYEAIDLLPFQGKNYYRIKQWDVNGAYSHSLVRTVSINTDDRVWRLYPNPKNAGQVLFIACEPDLSYNFRLFDATGREMLYMECSGSTEIPVTTLPAGIYRYELSSGPEKSAGQLVVLP